MVERDLDDLWAVAFKLRDVLVKLEAQLTTPAGGVDVSATPPPTGGGHFSPDDGVPLQFGDALDEGAYLRYYAGPCYGCGRAAVTMYNPRPGTSGQHRCWTCFKKDRAASKREAKA